MDEIRQSLATGKEVITHTDAVSVPGWTGAGYIIFDPITGDGAYKISGGTNGGFLLFLGALIFVLGLFFAANVTVLFALPLLVQGAIAFIAGFLSALSEFGLKFLESATVFRLLAAYIALLVVGELIAIQVLLGALLFFLLTFVLI